MIKDRVRTLSYKKAIENEFYYYAILGLSMLDKMEKNYEAAIENLNQLKNISGINFQLSMLLSDCYMALNKREMATKVISEALQKGIQNRELKKRLNLLKEKR